jgi:hypothetical protein
MMNPCTLHDQAVIDTLTTLHSQARSDWKLIRFLPLIKFPLPFASLVFLMSTFPVYRIS